MTEGFYDIAGAIAVAAESLVIPRAIALLAALAKSPQFSVVDLFARSSPQSEIIAVDTAIDSVPPNNQPGIRYRERLALIVPADARSLIEVRALRKSFPVLSHQNHVTDESGASLCLYFEPPLSVNRTWTAQSFLRRIEWWLEKSAKGELHPADQPVEQLFFPGKYELVLPWNFELASAKERAQYVLEDQGRRSDGGVTFRLQQLPAGVATTSMGAAVVEIELSPVVHGVIERDPAILGELADLLERRGTNLPDPLRRALGARVGSAGAPAASDETFTVFLLHMPMLRAAGDATPSAVGHRAFILDGGTLKLGADLGVLFLLDKTYYNAAGVLEAAPAFKWRERGLWPVGVVRENTRAAARSQSGIAEEGPQGVLVGAGSLGSAMLNVWSRSGWGEWSVIDKDYIKPHNLSRHSAYLQHIGKEKTETVSQLHDASIGDGTVKPIFGDACDFSKSEIVNALRGAALVVDASATLEYPRQASTAPELGRHVSVFLSPSGNGAVMLAEDAKRELKARDLEAQYYRAVIQSPWGKDHLVGNLGTFWSGASCRDISTVLPYSRTLAHAATLAEQVRFACNNLNALACVWERDPATGEVLVHDIEVHATRSMTLAKLTVYIDKGLDQWLKTARASALPNETGGVLLGYYDFNINSVLVVCALPAPPDSKSSPTFFERGTEGLVEKVNEATRRTAGIVGYIGEWHSHPEGHGTSQSGPDIAQLCHLAFGMGEDGLPALQLIVGEMDVQIYQATLVT